MQSSQLKWIYAQLYLAWVGFVHYVRKFWPSKKKQSGLELFEQNYFAEGHLPVSPELRAIAHEPGRCTTCGLCDAACPKAFSPMRMLLSGKNLGPDCPSCKICEAVCPERIPIISYVQLSVAAKIKKTA